MANVDSRDVMVGDEIAIRGTVERVVPGVGVLVRLFSKTDVYPAWVRWDDVIDVINAGAPPEPPDLTWLAGDVDDDGFGSVFRRDDAEGHNDDGRRFDRHWWDVAGCEWVDWPTAWRRGANPRRVLTERGDPSSAII